MAQCCRNIQSSFIMCLGIRKVCLGSKRFDGNINKKYFKKSKNSEKNKIMIWGIQHFITKLKTKIDVIPRGCFKCSGFNQEIILKLQKLENYANDMFECMLPLSQ